MKNTEKYAVKNVKSFEGHDGYGFSANLYRDGKKVASVLDEAHGGEYYFDFVSNEERDRFDAMVVKLEAVTETFGGNEEHTYIPDGDCFVSSLVDDYEHVRWAKRKCKKAVMFKLKGDHLHDWRKLDLPYCAKVKEALAHKYGDQLGEILNETIAV